MHHARPATSGGAQDPGPGAGDAAAPQGLAWSWELDFDALQAALDAPAPWNRPAPAGGGRAAGSATADSGTADGDGADGAEGASVAGTAGEEDQEALLDAMLATERSREIPAAVVAGRIAECLPAGPGLAAWLARAEAGELGDGALAGMAASFRRMASWAQAGELAMVAQIASRAAARDVKAGVDGDGRPARVPVSAYSEVSLGLVMTQCAASWWTDLAVTLQWRLRETGVALAEGRIDLSRARLIAEAASVLGDEAARAVEERVLPGAGELTTGQLRAALRRAVIAVDPEGAERRREEAERRAKVSLYGDEDGTAALSGSGLPVIHASAAWARITAMARALKVSGATGGMDLLRAQVFIGLLLGTLPFIPPAEGAPPDVPPPDVPPPDVPPPGGDGGPGDGGPRDGGGPAPGNAGFSGHRGRAGPDAAAPGRRPGPSCAPEEVPWPGDLDAPPDEGDPCDDGRQEPSGYDDAEDTESLSGPAPVWAPLPGVIPPAFSRPESAQAGTGRPMAGRLDLALPWSVLAGLSAEPGHLGRIGPVTATQARRLAEAASADPGAQWRVIVTSSAGQALAVTRVPRRAPARGSPGREEPGGPSPGSGLVGRVTLTLSEDTLTGPHDHHPAGGIAAAALRAAAHAAARATAQAVADAAASGCAHDSQSAAYRPPPRLQEFVTARDLTCRFPTCRQPAWRGDLDHTIPWPRGRTCRCNLGGLCRTHHLLKHHPGWELTQAAAPGTFTWTTPAGRSYTATPDTHPV
jgi:Domain of unknown function (DUF222)